MPLVNPTAATLIRKQDPKGSARAATTVALPANTRAENVLTADANGALPAIDGVTLVVSDPVERVLVKNEATGENNGIYDVTDVGSAGSKWVLTRSADFDADEKVTSGAATFVSEGTVNAGREYTLITADPITINTTALVFTQTGGTTPAAHDLGGAGHNADTLVNLNTKVSDANLDDSGASRTPIAHALGGAEHLASTLVELNVKVSDANLDDSGATRTPTAHALGGAEHTADTLVNLNAKINDANLDDSTASRTPSGSASGDLEGTYPDPTVKQSSETVAGKIERATQVETDAGSDDTRAVTPLKLETKPLKAPVIFSAEDDGDSSTTGTAFVQKLRLTFTAEAADYLIFYSAEIRTANTNVDVLARVQEDDTITHAQVEITQSSNVDNYATFSGLKKVTLTAASHDFDIDFASETVGKTVNIRRARLVAMKVQ